MQDHGKTLNNVECGQHKINMPFQLLLSGDVVHDANTFTMATCPKTPRFIAWSFSCKHKAVQEIDKGADYPQRPHPHGNPCEGRKPGGDNRDSESLHAHQNQTQHWSLHGDFIGNVPRCVRPLWPVIMTPALWPPPAFQDGPPPPGFVFAWWCRWQPRRPPLDLKLVHTLQQTKKQWAWFCPGSWQTIPWLTDVWISVTVIQTITSGYHFIFTFSGYFMSNVVKFKLHHLLPHKEAKMK